ncbi:peptide/nickel transport system substrate-binding protein [Williamsia limnetica]|uniref:Peptide/nickel transport system substrate-binding protein n=1 Tax=Williamsia limnetica TaxID=882452 RepID=A0A318RWH2_WILLI|nr:ABC transporter substrate-binding protein [Williamsia limnetica]PYE21072.1 peptide/nickel transport system substrate-binding protein [Williamsia limnetica]
MSTRAVVGAAVAAVSVAGLLVACSDPAEPTINYVLDAAVTTYNTETLSGSTGGAVMALSRVLPGFSYLGPDGRVIADTDIGSTVVEPAESGALTIRYDINPAAVYSDGVPLTCDALVLAWAAHSGRFNGFDAISTAGYRDIDTVDCRPGSKTATVTFARGRAYRDWRALFGPGTLLPPQAVARAAGVADVVDPISRVDRRKLADIARIWSTGWAMTPGDFDSDRYPALGPMRVADYTEDGGLILRANDRWWGQPAGDRRIALWPRHSALTEDLADGKGGDTLDVLDIAAGTYGVDPVPRGSPSIPPAPAAGLAPLSSLGTERIVMAGTGVLASPALRRAFAACVPRDGLAREFGRGTPVSNNHLLGPDELLTGTINAEFGRDYLRADPVRAEGEARDARRGNGPLTIRVGYLAPDGRRAQMVAAIAASCQAAGITVTDVASDSVGPTSLGGDADALITASGNGFAATGAADPTRDTYAFYGGDPSNVGGYRNVRVSALIDQLAVTVPAADRLSLVREIESLLWRDMPALPLFTSPRTRRAGDNVDNVVPGLSRAGTGWNIDRWMVARP